jgi:hypothetical protein
MPNHRYILSAGHHNTQRGGASGEFEWTYPSCKALKAAIEARGGQAWIIQEEDGDSDPTMFTNGGRQAAAAACVDLASEHGPFDAYISSHYNGGRSPGFHAIHPDGWHEPDRKKDNPKDVQLCRAIRDRVKATNTVGLISWTADSPGVMSERESGAVDHTEPKRLGEMVGTFGFRNTTARVIIEAGSIDVARERAFINDKNWVRNVYAEAVVDALEDVFGAFPQARIPVHTDVGVVAPKPRPRLTQYRDRDEANIPAAIQDDGQWYFWIGHVVRVTKQTRRMQFADDDAPSVGPDLMPATADAPADEFFAAWGGIAPNGRPFVHTFFDSRIWLEDTDFGVSD